MSQRRRTRRRRATPPAILIALLLIVSVYLYRSGELRRMIEQAAPDASVGTTAVGSGDMRVFFTTPALVYPDKANQRPPSPLLQAVLADLDAAQATIDLAVFDLDVNEIAEALIRARARGVVARVVIDSENLATPEVSELTGRLERVGIAVRFDDREPFMHNKFIVVDDTITWMGSWNFTANDTWRNNNNMLRFVSDEIAADYAREFEQMFAGRFGTSKTSATPHPQVRVGAAVIEVYFSPQDGIAKQVLQRVTTAQRSIHFMTFSYTADPIADAMIAQVEAGLVVRGVFEKQNAGGSGADFNRLKAGGVDVLEDGNCYILHHKIIVIDDRTVITGSYNFTGSAERSNDENLMIIDDATLARAYLEEFARVYAQAQTPTRCR